MRKSLLILLFALCSPTTGSFASPAQVSGNCQVQFVLDPETGLMMATCLQQTCTGTCELVVTPRPGGVIGYKCPCE